MEVSLPLGTWDGLCFFIVAFPGPSVYYLGRVWTCLEFKGPCMYIQLLYIYT